MNLIGGDDDFGDFVAPQSESSKKNDDDFGDFMSSDNTAPSSSTFVTPPSTDSVDIWKNLSDLYSQSNPTLSTEPDNKYAALENMSSLPQPQPQLNIFSGMTMQQPSNFPTQFQQTQPPYPK